MTRDEVIDLVRDAGYGVLASVEGNAPKARPMMPHLTEEGELLVAVLSHSRTIKQIKDNPRVEMCFIDRKMRFARLTGHAKISQDLEKKQTVWDNIPMLRQYFSGPEDVLFVLIDIDITSVEAMSPQQRTPDILTLK